MKLANAKLQGDPGTAALKLMDCVFTTHELVNSNPSGVTKSKDTTRQKTIKRLDPAKMQYIDGNALFSPPAYMKCITSITDFLQDKWGLNTTDKGIRKRMTPKCTDYFTDPRYTHLRAQSWMYLLIISMWYIIYTRFICAGMKDFFARITSSLQDSCKMQGCHLARQSLLARNQATCKN